MAAILADSYALSRAFGYPGVRHASRVVRARNFYDRVRERMREMAPLMWRDRLPTQAAVAALIGIRQPSVHKWAQGKLPEMKHAVAVAQVLGVCLEWLLTERGPKYPPAPDDAAQELLAIWGAHPDIQRELLRYARFLAQGDEPKKKKPAQSSG